MNAQQYVDLRKKGLTLQQIADLDSISRQRVWQVLDEVGKTGRREFPQLKDPNTFDGRTDEEIAKQLGLTVNRVTKARRALGLFKPRNEVSLAKRQNFISKKLWGKPADENFTQRFFNMLFLARNLGLSFEQYDRLWSFYVLGKDDIEPNARAKRTYARKRFLEIIGRKNGQSSSST